MKVFKLFLCAAIVMLTGLLDAQPSFYDLTFRLDSVVQPYAPGGNNYVFVRSKRGTSGVNKTTAADSILTFKVSTIVLVFTEETPEAIENREEYNQERWENLIMTYPEFFQVKTIYKNICQCSAEAGGDDFKQKQGFYIYYSNPAAAAAPKKAEAPAAPPPPPPVPEQPVKKNPAKEPVVTKKSDPQVNKTEPPVAVNEPPPPPVPPVKEEPKKQVLEEEVDNSGSVSENESHAKKKGPAKPKRSKDKKACRPSCYGYGDEDLNAFFKDNITLTKKQKRKGKKQNAELRLQLNFDGTIKKATVTGENEELNKQITDAVKNMNPWNPAVKGGVAIKSEVRLVLKYDKPTKSIKPAEVVINPRPNPKCNRCMSDSDLGIE
jgi:hypothetical protein